MKTGTNEPEKANDARIKTDDIIIMCSDCNYDELLIIKGAVEYFIIKNM